MKETINGSLSVLLAIVSIIALVFSLLFYFASGLRDLYFMSLVLPPIISVFYLIMGEENEENKTS